MPTLFQRVRGGPGFLTGLALILAALPLQAADKNPVIVHEWGTFTSLQDENGRAIGGINVDDEPVPGFVCQYANRMVASQYGPGDETFGLPPYMDEKGWISGDPDVTMRLETPVIYIYPPKGTAATAVPPLDVHVDFHGGVLSQFYPYAKASGTGVTDVGDTAYMPNPHISSTMTTSLTWKGVQVGASGQPFLPATDYNGGQPRLRGAVVDTDDSVWTTPRETSAPLLGVKFSYKDSAHPEKTDDFAQTEHFLFYRGIGQVDSPLCLRNNHDLLQINSPLSPPGADPVRKCWLVEIRPDGSCAFRIIDSPHEGDISGRMRHLGVTASGFSDSDFSTLNLDVLKGAMKNELVAEGLYEDEAAAMLQTWELSYFKSPGLRFFFAVPRSWTDRVLPLQISGAPVQLTRVMIGRIELISDSQQKILDRLAVGPAPDLAPVKQAAAGALDHGHYTDAEKMAFSTGRRPLRDLAIPIPNLVQDYLDLGRFRDALIVHREHEHPTEALAQFIRQNKIGSMARDASTPASGVAATR